MRSVLNFQAFTFQPILVIIPLAAKVPCATVRDFTDFLSKNKIVSGHGFISAAGTYLSPYNVLDFPAGIVRVTSVTKEDDNMISYPDHDMWHKGVIEVMAPISLFQLMP